METRFLTIKQAADEIGISAKYLRKRLANGKLPGFRSGNRFLVNVSMLCAELEKESRASMCQTEDDKCQ